MGWHEVIRRYRRTSLGPFWTTASLALFICTIGFMYSAVWQMDIAKYLPYLASGFIVWIMMSGTISESCAAFISAEALLKQVRFPYTGLVCAVVLRNIIITGHHIVIYVIVWLMFPQPVGWVTLLVLPGLGLWVVNGVWIGIVLGIACARFRDIQQLVSSILQVAMFVTPILYPVDALLRLRGSGEFLVYLNPLHHFVDVIRAPLLGHAPDMLSYEVTAGAAVFGTFFCLWLLDRTRHKIVFWV